jgi:hypothetical protein
LAAHGSGYGLLATPTAVMSYPLYTLFFNKKLKEVETIKFLGLQRDNHLTCKGHIDFLLQKLSTVGFLMQKSSYTCTLNINNLKAVYMYKCKCKLTK